MTKLREYEKLINNILSQNSESNVKSIVVSSSASGEGTSTIALNISKILAKNKDLKVCLIDGNLRKPAQHKLFNLEKKAGLADHALGSDDVNDILKKTDVPNLRVVTSGDSKVNPVEIFKSNEMKDFIKELKNRFNYLVFDSAPINAFPDVHILSSHVDGVILVVHAERTRWEVAQKAKDQLQMANAKIFGVVLNRKRYYIPDFIYRRL